LTIGDVCVYLLVESNVIDSSSDCGRGGGGGFTRP